jgi:hypothetical protein
MNDYLNEIRVAKVIDNKDPDCTGKLKLRIMPEFNGIDISLLPWCRPFILHGNGNPNAGSHNIPSNDEMIKCIIRDKFWKNIEWLNGDFVDGFYPYSKIDFSKISELTSQIYPNPNLELFSDGSFTFRNINTGESGIYNSNGSYIIFDSTGKIIEKSNLGISLDGDTSGKIKIKNSTATLHTILKDTISIVKNIITPLNLVDSLKAPVVYSQVTADLPKITIALTQIDQLMED